MEHIPSSTLSWKDWIVDRGHRLLHYLYLGRKSRELLHLNFTGSDVSDDLKKNAPVFDAVLNFSGGSQEEAHACLVSAVAQTHVMLDEHTCLAADPYDELGMYAGRQMTAFHLAVLQDKVAMVKALYMAHPSFLHWSCDDVKFSGESALHLAVAGAARSPYWTVSGIVKPLDASSGCDQASTASLASQAHPPPPLPPPPPPDDDMLVFIVQALRRTNDETGPGTQPPVGDRLNVSRARGHYFDSASEKQQMSWGDSPLSWAACLGLPRVVSYLSSQGGDMFTTDSKDNNLLHILAAQTSHSSKESDSILDSDAGPSQSPTSDIAVEVCGLVRSLACRQKGCQHAEREPYCLETQLNAEGMTPLHVAAHYGNKSVFLYLINLPSRRHELLKYGSACTVAYNLQDLDYMCPHNRQQWQQQPSPDHPDDCTDGVDSAAVTTSSMTHGHVSEREKGIPLLQPAVRRAHQWHGSSSKSSNDHPQNGQTQNGGSGRRTFPVSARLPFPETILEVIMSSSNKQGATELLSITPMRELVLLKWMQFGYFGFTLLLCYNLLYTILLSLIIYYRPLRTARCPGVLDDEQYVPDMVSSESGVDDTSVVDGSGSAQFLTAAGNASVCSNPTLTFTSGYETTSDYVRLCAELYVLANALVQIAFEVRDIYRYHGKVALFGWVARGYWFMLLKWFNLLLVLLAAVLRLSRSDYERIVLTWIIMMAWMYTLMYGRCFRIFGHYLMSLQKVLVRDIPMFFLLFYKTLVGFSLVFYVLYQNADTPAPAKFSNFWRSTVTLFRVSIGLTDVDLTELSETQAVGWAALYLVMFLVISYLLLINFLIATMQHTQDRVLERSNVVWFSLIAASIIFVEKRLPWLFPERLLQVGRRGEELGLLAGARYLCIRCKAQETAA